MDRATRFTRILLLCLVLVLLATPVALAEETETTEAVEDFSGTYQIAGSTNKGSRFSATIVIQDGGQKAAVTGAVPRIGTITRVFDVKQVGDGAYEITGGVWYGVISGSGTVTVTRAGEGFDLSGTASGSAFGTKGSVTFEGGRTSTAIDSPVSTQIDDNPATKSETKKPLSGADNTVKPLAGSQDGKDPIEVDTTTKAGVTGVVALLIAIQIILEVITGGGISSSRIGDLLKAGAEVTAVAGTKSEAKTTWEDAMAPGEDAGSQGGDE